MRKSIRVARFLTVKSIARGNVRVLALTIVMLILVYLNLIFTPAILEGLVNNVNDKVINTLAGDITIQSDATQPAMGKQDCTGLSENSGAATTFHTA